MSTSENFERRQMLEQNPPLLREVEHAVPTAAEVGFTNEGHTTATTSQTLELQTAIRDAVLDRDTPAFDKRRLIRDLVRDQLLQKGFLCRTEDDRAFYFNRQERRLYDIEQRAFQHLLSDLSGLSATEAYLRFVLDSLQTQAARTKPLTVHSHSYYDPATGLLCVSDGAGGVWRRERFGKWELAYNGDHGTLFFTEPDAQPWTPNFTDSRALAWFLRQPMFDGMELSAEEQQLLFLIFILQTFFPALRRTRIIPAALGPQGSGKTSALKMFGMLFGGPEFDVTGLSANREDAFVAAVCNAWWWPWTTRTAVFPGLKMPLPLSARLQIVPRANRANPWIWMRVLASPRGSAPLVATNESAGPAAVSVDDFVDFGHDADGFAQSDDDLLVVFDIGLRELAALAVFEPLLTNLIAANMKLPDLFGHASEPTGMRSIHPDASPRVRNIVDLWMRHTLVCGYICVKFCGLH